MPGPARAKGAPAILRTAIVIGALVVAGAACGGSGETADAPSDASEGPVASARADAESPRQRPDAERQRPDHERPLPAFGGVTLEDERLSVSDLLGRRFLLFVFNPEVDVAAPTAEAVAAIAGLRREHNFQILAVATGSRRQRAERFVADHHLDVPVIDDAGARIAGTLRLPVPVMLGIVDAEGYVTYTTGWREGTEIDAAMVETLLRERLRLPAAPTPTRPVLGERPPAPEVAGTDLEGETFRLSAHRGEPVLLMFFLHTCPHCHHAMEFLKAQLPEIPESKRPKLVGISVVDRAYAVREQLREDGLDFFPVIMDPDGALRDAYDANQGVPALVLVDAEGRIVHRSSGWSQGRDPALWRMWLAKVSGTPVPMLLHKSGYSGDAFCGVCHTTAADTHQFTSHAYAFDTLVKHGADRSAECVSCHVVGFGEPGGYTMAEPRPYLEGVGCETCHGRGGPHLSPQHVQDGNYEPVCVTCHDTKHSLGFEYATFLPKVSHAANAHLLALPLEEKLDRIEALGGVRDSILPSDAEFVGSEACQGCHPAEYETWAGNPHADAGRTLAEQGKAGDAECLACHTTGYGEPGGFPAGAGALAHPDLGRVGCESCHGPGGDHVPAEATKAGTIVSLTDKCGSCVILQICGGCHDDQNDPGFEFRVQEGIDRLRHGTIEPSNAKGGQASHRHGPAGPLPHTAVLGALERALADGEPAG